MLTIRVTLFTPEADPTMVPPAPATRVELKFPVGTITKETTSPTAGVPGKAAANNAAVGKVILKEALTTIIPAWSHRQFRLPPDR